VYKIQLGVLAPAPKQHVITPCVVPGAGAPAVTARKQDPCSDSKLAVYLKR